MDFKAQLAEDMRVFHNPAEFATIAGFYYDRKWYEVPVVLDHEAAAERQRPGGDNAPGLSSLEAVAYVSLYDLGFMPERDHKFAVKVAGVTQQYNIERAHHEDGEIILELGALGER